MKKRLWLIIICCMLFIPTVQAETKYKKICTDYSYDKCPDGKQDERGNTCKASGDKCYISVIKKTCSNVVPEACSEADGHCCGVDSAGNSCTYDINTKKCKNVVTYSRKATCSDWTYDDCPSYSDNGTACMPYEGKCQTAKKSQSIEETENSGTITSTGRIKAITCTGNSEDKIPSALPSFVRALYNVLKVLVPLVIIFFGIFDFVRAATSSNETDMDSHKNKFMRRIIAGVAIFFVLAITQWIFGLVGEKDNILGCVSCFLTTKNDCKSAGYIDPGKNDNKGETPNKTPPKSTNKVSQSSEDDSSSNSKNITVNQILTEAKKVTDFIKNNNFIYGNALKNPAINHSEKTISCDRCVGWVLYNLGYKDQPEFMGLVVESSVPENDLPTFCEKNGFKKITKFQDIKAGDIIFLRAGSTGTKVSHVYILGNKKSNNTWERYDCGSLEFIRSTQPIIAANQSNRFLFAYRIADN